MKKFIHISIGSFIIFAILIFGSICFYDTHVQNGHWGSVSDMLVALGTALIAYFTFLLVAAAYITSKSWLDKEAHLKATEFLETLAAIFHHQLIIYSTNSKLAIYHDLRKKQVGDEIKFGVKDINGAQSMLQSIGVNTKASSYSEADLASINNYSEVLVPIYKESILKAKSDVDSLIVKAMILASNFGEKVDGVQLDKDIHILRSTNHDNNYAKVKQIIKKYAHAIDMKDFKLTVPDYEPYERGSL
ncbi:MULTISPECIES: hypothetical protein [Pseudoalteromonas]|nr:MULTISPECIES: hypothetical protein [Pseudoalteromonas]